MQGQWDPDSDNDRRERASASQQRLSFEYGSRVDPLLDRAASHVPLIGAAFKTTTTTLARWLAHAPIRRARYEDFSSIDWIYDNNKGRRARRRLRQKSQRTLKGKLYLFYDSLQSWIVLLGVGIAMGIIATFMATTSQWMSDIKGGYCRGRFYLNKRFCCLEAIDQSTNESRPCEDWIAWSDALHISWPWMAWLVQSIAFVCSGVLFAGLSTYLVTEYAPYAAGQGIAEIKTIMSGFVMRQFLGLRTLVVKCIGTPLSVASGLNVGKEAPLVHIACCCGNVLTRPFPSLRGNESQKRQVLSAASAAGISVAFGAPIGGVLFSLEEVSYYFPAETMWRSFFCASVAAITLKFFDPFRNGKLVPFQVTYDRTFYPFELLFVVVIGVIGGLVGTMIVRLYLRLLNYRQTSRLRHFGRGEVVAVAVITAIVSCTSPLLRDDLVTLVSDLLGECKGDASSTEMSRLCDPEKYNSTTAALIFMSIIRMALTIVACGLAIPAGIFMPSMGIGAGIGRAIGIMVQHWQESNPHSRIFSACPPDIACITPGVYALVGAAALLASTTRMTATIVIIMFELTGALIYVLPIMVAVMVSKWTRDAFTDEGIFEGIIRINRYPYLGTQQDKPISGTAGNLMTTAEELQVISAAECTLGQIQRILSTCHYQGLPVVTSEHEMRLLGYISCSDLRFVVEQALESGEYSNDSICYFGSQDDLNELITDDSHDMAAALNRRWIDLRPWMDHTPITVRATMPLVIIADEFRQLGIRYVLVTDNGTIIGMITRKDMQRSLTAKAEPGARGLAQQRFQHNGGLSSVSLGSMFVQNIYQGVFGRGS